MTNVERILAAYAEAEPWKADHDDARFCFRAEEVIAIGNAGFMLVTRIDAAWQDHVAGGRLPFKEEDDRQVGEFYRMWVAASERLLPLIEELGRDGFEINGVDEFLTHLEEARSILESRALEAEMRPIEEVLPLAKGNPRPERYGK
jgi:hypothetical protein